MYAIRSYYGADFIIKRSTAARVQMCRDLVEQKHAGLARKCPRIRQKQRNQDVITSYSIHYTKLYEADDPPRAVTLALARQISAVSGATVIAAPWPLSDGPDRRIEVRVEQFLATAGGVVRLSGSYYVSPAREEGRDIRNNFV